MTTADWDPAQTGQAKTDRTAQTAKQSTYTPDDNINETRFNRLARVGFLHAYCRVARDRLDLSCCGLPTYDFLLGLLEPIFSHCVHCQEQPAIFRRVYDEIYKPHLG